jgi:hypothetical protein
LIVSFLLFFSTFSVDLIINTRERMRENGLVYDIIDAGRKFFK